MTRMICIGAQSIEVAELTPLRPVIEKGSRRVGDPAHLRTYFGHPPMEVSAKTIEQLPLFEERVAPPSIGEQQMS